MFWTIQFSCQKLTFKTNYQTIVEYIQSVSSQLNVNSNNTEYVPPYIYTRVNLDTDPNDCLGSEESTNTFCHSLKILKESLDEIDRIYNMFC